MKFEYAVSNFPFIVEGNARALIPPTDQSGWRVRETKIVELGRSKTDPGTNAFGSAGSYSSKTITESAQAYVMVLWERAIPEAEDTPPL